jgi:transposase
MHYAKKVREEANKLDILLVYLFPPHSPDLNLIENVWKGVKRICL